MLLQFLFSRVNWLYIKPVTVDTLLLPPGPPVLSRFSWLLFSYLSLKRQGCLKFLPLIFLLDIFSWVISFKSKSSDIKSMLMTPKSRSLALISLLITEGYWKKSACGYHSGSLNSATPTCNLSFQFLFLDKVASFSAFLIFVNYINLKTR